LFERERVARLDIFPKMSGMLPFIAALEKSRVVSAIVVFSDVGKGPERSGFEETFKVESDCIPPKISGINPVWLFPYRNKYRMAVALINDLGIGPVRSGFE